MHLQRWMTEAGFEEVESRLLRLPLSGWSNGNEAWVAEEERCSGG